jgi:ATP-dependent Clp protease ATP-binding subunit ClpC
MSGTILNPKSARARQARFKHHLAGWSQPVGWTLIAALVVAWLFALSQQQQLGWTALGVGLLLLMAQIWNRWQLQVLAPVGLVTPQDLRLDQVLEADLLGRLRWPSSLAQVWDVATRQWEGVFMINRLAIPSNLVAQLVGRDESVDVWGVAAGIAAEAKLPEIDSGVVIAAILTSSKQLKPLLTELKIDSSDIMAVLDWQQRLKQAMADLHAKQSFGGIGRDWASGYTPTLSQFAKNLSHEIEYGYYQHLPQVHEEMVDQMVTQLVSNRSTVALVGDVGSGKTSLVYSLAERLLKARDARGLEYYYVMQLNASMLISAGGNLEAMVLQCLSEAIHAKNIIIFLDEAQLFFGSGTGAVDLSKVLLPILQQSSLKLILALSSQDWQQLTAKNPGLTTSLQRILVTPPDSEDTMRIVQDAAIGIEHQSNGLITYQAVQETYRLADRYLVESAFPGKAIALLDTAINYAEDGIVTTASVQRAVEATVGTKVTAATTIEKEQLLKLEDEIHLRMINQTHAVKVVSDALRRARAGVRNTSRPVGSFLFLGPTGVGKTELARALADIYFGGVDQIVRVDMSEYQQPSDISRLLSASSKTSGTTLISGIRKHPFSVVLFDEIEKAHPDVLNLLLQLLDEGRLTDTDGRIASFKDAIVIATSNASADTIRKRIAAGENLENFEREIEEELVTSHQFKPELLNRFDDIVLFRPLTKPELRQVVQLMIGEVNATLEPQKISVAITTAAADWLVDRGYDPRLGARPMRRMVQRAVENTVAQRILKGEIQPGQQLKLDVGDLQSGQNA